MTYAKSIKLFLLLSIVLASAIALINFIIDPFQQYRKAIFHKTIFTKAYYLNAGLIKNHTYDSISLGSSMTENFILEEVSTYLNYEKPIKLPLRGGSIEEHSSILAAAIHTKKVIQYILMHI